MLARLDNRLWRFELLKFSRRQLTILSEAEWTKLKSEILSKALAKFETQPMEAEDRVDRGMAFCREFGFTCRDSAVGVGLLFLALGPDAVLNEEGLAPLRDSQLPEAERKIIVHQRLAEMEAR